MQLVYCAPDTRAMMAAPAVVNGIRTVKHVSITGEEAVATGLKFSGPDPALTETYLDLISGERFAKLSLLQAAEMDPEEIYTGCGSVSGLFTPLPETEELPDEGEGAVVGEGETTTRRKAKKSSKKAA